MMRPDSTLQSKKREFILYGWLLASEIGDQRFFGYNLRLHSWAKEGSGNNEHWSTRAAKPPHRSPMALQDELTSTSEGRMGCALATIDNYSTAPDTTYGKLVYLHCPPRKSARSKGWDKISLQSLFKFLWVPSFHSSSRKIWWWSVVWEASRAASYRLPFQAHL